MAIANSTRNTSHQDALQSATNEFMRIHNIVHCAACLVRYHDVANSDNGLSAARTKLLEILNFATAASDAADRASMADDLAAIADALGDANVSFRESFDMLGAALAILDQNEAGDTDENLTALKAILLEAARIADIAGDEADVASLAANVVLQAA